MKNIFKVFPNFTSDIIIKAKGPYLYLKKSGKIKKIMVDNAQPVEFEQVLFIIEE